MPSVNAGRAFGAFLFISSLSAGSSSLARAEPIPSTSPTSTPAPVESRPAAQPVVVATRAVPVAAVVDVGPTTTAARSPEPRPVDRKADTRRWMIVSGAAATTLGVVMGTAFAILSESKRAERDKQIDATRGCQGLACEPYNAPERSRGAFLTGALVSFLAAGAIGAGTLTYSLVTRPKKSRMGAASATVSIGPEGAAARVGITW